MGVFKENAIAFEKVANKQRQIWNDSCDYGFAYNSNNKPEEIKDLIFMVNDLKKTGLIINREGWKDGVSVTIRIGWEIDEGYECGTQYKISFNRINSNKQNLLVDKTFDSFISVDIESYRSRAKN